MKFIETKLQGAYIIELEPHKDSRGFFARSFCAHEFGEHGLATTFVQCSLSSTRKKGTVRGLHFQRAPACEVKLVRCTGGVIHDIIVDLRANSPTYLEYVAVELSADNRRAVYVPMMFAHGFQALSENSEVFYQIDQYYSSQASSGIRYSDPRLGITWPLSVTDISAKDANWPLL